MLYCITSTHNVRRTLYGEQSTVHTVRHTLYGEQSTVHNVRRTLYDPTGHVFVYDIQSSLDIKHYEVAGRLYEYIFTYGVQFIYIISYSTLYKSIVDVYLLFILNQLNLNSIGTRIILVVKE